MAYDAKVLNILIASPGDVREERRIVREVVAEWNVINAQERQLVLMPVGWETHSSPELSGRPQGLINERILNHADILIGIFWTRIGSNTGKAASGTVEEIQEHHAKGRPVMLYFSDVAIPPDRIEPDQYKMLQEFKSWARSAGLIESYSNHESFSAQLRRHIPLALSQNPYVQSIIGEMNISVDPIEAFEAALKSDSVKISSDAYSLLEAAAADKGEIHHLRSISKEVIGAGGKVFNTSEPRSIAKWVGRLEELEGLDYIRSKNSSKSVYGVTAKGYEFIEAREPD